MDVLDFCLVGVVAVVVVTGGGQPRGHPTTRASPAETLHDPQINGTWSYVLPGNSTATAVPIHPQMLQHQGYCYFVRGNKLNRKPLSSSSGVCQP